MLHALSPRSPPLPYLAMHLTLLAFRGNLGGWHAGCKQLTVLLKELKQYSTVAHAREVRSVLCWPVFLFKKFFRRWISKDDVIEGLVSLQEPGCAKSAAPQTSPYQVGF